MHANSGIYHRFYTDPGSDLYPDLPGGILRIPLILLFRLLRGILYCFLNLFTKKKRIPGYWNRNFGRESLKNLAGKCCYWAFLIITFFFDSDDDGGSSDSGSSGGGGSFGGGGAGRSF